MVWIIVGAIVVLAVVFWGTTRVKVLKKKVELQDTIRSVITSFRELGGKIEQSQLKDNEKKILLDNIARNVETLERWESTAIPNITFWKNHTDPIEKEFRSLKEGVAFELSKYEGLPDLTV